ncbi:MAG TPA: TIR domain-containing protein [Polyangiaceae bacterium]|nr:TIR domain-containing protein [Polyangiaceae bacterium]
MRHVYFSFHYEHDIWRVNQVRNSGLLFGAKSVGFVDHSLWEEAKIKGAASLEQLILEGLTGTSATVVLIGEHTADRKWVQFELEQSHRKNNALLGIRIHLLKDGNQKTSHPGKIPPLLKEVEAPIYDWTASPHDLGAWVEEAIEEQCE